MNFINYFFHFGNNKESKKVTSSVSGRVINSAYIRRTKEIHSLQEYDQGKKNIDAPNFRNNLSRLQETT
ncbi:hypothetical protein HQ403_00600 [Candidatus Kaiserbacteria bacterium]|nr:hypothetical protein [Candidatus Kaiserbacteria bacterium]